METVTIPAREVQAGTTYTDASGTNWVVTRSAVDAPSIREDAVLIRLSAGRSQPEFREVFRATELLTITRDS